MNQTLLIANRFLPPGSARQARPLRVLHVLPSLEVGGMENGVVNLCHRLAPEQIESAVCVFEPGGSLEARLDPRQTPLLVAARGFGNDPRVPLQLARYVRRHRIDILHTHSWGTLLEGLAAAKLARVAGFVHGEHGTLETRSRNVFFQRWAWRVPQRVLAVCGTLAEQLAAVVGFPRNRITVIPNGVDTDRFRPANGKAEARREFGLPERGTVLGMVARLIPVKNHAGVFHAVAALREAGTDVHLALAGDGPLRGDLQRLADTLAIVDRVHFLGETQRVERILHALDIYVSNSHREGMSNTILEAMACGLPIIATAVGATEELLAGGGAGLLIPPRDTLSLVHACRELLRQPALRGTLGLAARDRAETVFSLSRMIEGYSRMYLDLVGQAAGPTMAAGSGPDRTEAAPQKANP